MAKYCKNCGTQLPDGAAFCPECGAKAPAEQKPKTRYCQNCGTKLPAGAAFCPECGTAAPIEIAVPEGATVTVSDAPPKAAKKPASKPAQPKTAAKEQTSQKKTAAPKPAAKAAPKTEDRQPQKAAPAKSEQPKTEQAAPSAKTPVKRRGLSLFLVLVMLFELGIAAFKYPGFLISEPDGPGIVTPPIVDPDGNGEPGGNGGKPEGSEELTTEDMDRQMLTMSDNTLLQLTGFTESDLISGGRYQGEVTPENSPDNPKFIDVSYTKQDYDDAPTAVRSVSLEDAEADFPEFGIHVNLKTYNLLNETDELIVRQLPAKTDTGTGHTLYTYDFSMASGQHEFPAEVELTIPIQGEPEQLWNVLWLNEETGRWEEVYYELSEDGRSYIAYIDHFTGVSSEEITLEQLQDMGDKFVKIFDNGNIFYEGQVGYETGHATDPVRLVKTPDFDKYARRETEHAKQVFEILRKGGGVPLSSAMTEAFDMLGFVSDSVSLGQGIGLIAQIPGFGGVLVGGTLAALGMIFLNLRVADQTVRSLNPAKVMEENRWNFVSATVGAFGALCSMADMAGVAAVCGWACILIFGGVTAYTLFTAIEDAMWPFGWPETLEANAYQYYLRNQGMPASVLQSLGVTSVDHLGARYGWAFAIEDIFKANGGRMNSEALGEKIIELYNNYVNYFWDEIPLEEQKEIWFDALVELRNHKIQDRLKWKFDAESERTRQADGSFIGPNASKERTIEEYCQMDSVKPYVINEGKLAAMDLAARNTNKIVYDLLQKEFHANALKAREIIYNEILPMMNTMLRFYAVDESLAEKEAISHSLYFGYDTITQSTDESRIAQWKFDGKKEPLYRSINVENPSYWLELKPQPSNPELLVCTVYHYLQYGAPGTATVTPPKGSPLEQLTAEVMLEEAREGPIVTYVYGKQTNVTGLHVPVRFNGESDEVIFETDLRVYFEDGFYQCSFVNLEETWGKEAEAHAAPKNIKLRVMQDGTVKLDMPAVVDLRDDDGWVGARDAVALRGFVFETQSRKMGGRETMVYSGVITGNYDFTASQVCYHNGEVVRRKAYSRLYDTSLYVRDGKSPDFSKFRIYYFPDDDSYAMHIILCGKEKEWSDGSSTVYDTEDTYQIQLTSTLDFGGAAAEELDDLMEELGWK